MRPLLYLFGLLLPCVAGGVDLPFKITDYRIPASDQVVLITSRPVVSISGVRIDVVQKGQPSPLMTAPLQRQDEDLLVLHLPKPLAKGEDYELRLISDAASSITAPSQGHTASGPFSVDPVAISTKPAAAIEPSYTFEDLGSVFLVKSKIGLKPISGAPAFNLLDYTGHVKKWLSATFEVNRPDNPRTSSWVTVTLADGLSQTSARLQVTGLTNIFDDALQTDTAAVTLAPLPKDISEASVYLKFLHQAGSGLPAWILNAKFAPQTGQSFGGGWRAGPTLDVDIGNRSVGTTKTNDVVKPGFGLTFGARQN